jgi:hypothetical protein
VKWALGTDSMHGLLWYEAMKAVEFGATPEQALAAVGLADRRNARAQPCVEANATKCLTSTIPLAILLDRWPAPAHLHEQGYYRHLFQHAHCQGQQAVLVPKRVAWEARV